MTNEQAKSELMQIYMSLSEEKKKALDVLMAQAEVNAHAIQSALDNGTNTVIGTGGMRDATPEEQEAIDKYIKSISKPTGVNFWDLADREYISRQAVMDCYKKWQPYMATRLHEFEKELSELPSVTIPPEHDGCKDCKYDTYPEYYYPCCECKQNYVDEWERAKIGHWIWQTEDIYQCSECGEDIHVKEVMNEPQYAWCPICGCPMGIER